VNHPLASKSRPATRRGRYCWQRVCPDQFSPTAHSNFLEDRLQVVLHGIGRDLERGHHLCRRQPAQNALHDLTLALGEDRRPAQSAVPSPPGLAPRRSRRSAPGCSDPTARDAWSTSQWPEAVRRRTFGSRAGDTSVLRSIAWRRATTAEMADARPACVTGPSLLLPRATGLGSRRDRTTDRSSAAGVPGFVWDLRSCRVPNSRALRNPSAMCDVSRPMKSDLGGREMGIDRSRCKHRKPSRHRW